MKTSSLITIPITSHVRCEYWKLFRISSKIIADKQLLTPDKIIMSGNNLIRVLLCFTVLASTVFSFSFIRFNIPKYSFNVEKMYENGRKGAIIGASVIAVCLLNVNGIQPAFADLASDDSAEIESVAPRPMRITSQADDVLKVQKKSSLLKSGVDKIASTEEDRSYSNSLKKEQAIQESRKKTKAERARDMCEMMGRGC